MQAANRRSLGQPQHKEVSIPNIRWIMYLKNGKPIVENHEHGRTWKKVYKDNYGNIEALCFQLIPEGVKFFIPPSESGEYWTYEESITPFGGSSRHVKRSICSKRETKLVDGKFVAYWNVISIDYNKQVTKSIQTSEEIGYHSLHV